MRFGNVRRMLLRVFLAVLLALPLVGILSGCAGVRHEVAAEKAFVAGKIGQVHAAALAALREWQVEIAKQHQDQFSSRIDGRFADGNTLSLVSNQVTANQVEVSVLIGAFGQKNRSQQLLDKIRAGVPR
jgi:hypothetical protein